MYVSLGIVGVFALVVGIWIYTCKRRDDKDDEERKQREKENRQKPLYG
jgi:cadmium resistance protein CadD (predicted permease)